MDAEASLRQAEAKRSRPGVRASRRFYNAALRAEKAAAYRAATSDVATDAHTPSEFARLPPPETIGDHGAAVRVAAACCRRLEARLAGCRACVASSRRDAARTRIRRPSPPPARWASSWIGSARGTWSSEIKRDGERLARACLDAEAARDARTAATPPPRCLRLRPRVNARARVRPGGSRSRGRARPAPRSPSPLEGRS